MSDRYAFTVLEYGYFFEMDEVDDRGLIKMNTNTGKPYTRWEKAYNVNDPKYYQRNWHEGHIWPWAVSTSWRTSLVSTGQQIGQYCGSCCTGMVHSLGWYCSNTNCNHPILGTDNSLTPKQQKDITTRPFLCPVCGTHAYPKEYVQCNSCQNGVRASIFDADLWGFKEKSGNSKGAQLKIANFAVRPPQFQTSNAVEVKSLPLDRIFEPFSVDLQRECWNIETTPAAHPPGGGGWSAPPGAPAAAPPGATGYAPAAAPTAYGAPQQQAYAHPQPQPVDNAAMAAHLTYLNQGNGQGQ